MLRGLIVTAVAALRKEPAIHSERIDEVLHGMIVYILMDCGGGWFEIMTSYFYKGFIHEGDLLFDDCVINEWIDKDKKVINHYSADVLDIPKVQGEILINLTRGCLLAKTEEEIDGFVKIILPDKRVGYVRKTFLGEPINFVDASESGFRQSVVNTAKLYLKTQYRWGGKTPLGIDCSGLCFMSYYLNGVTIYRDARINEDFPVRKIPVSSMKQGDLIYFPNHIAIYLGEGEFIHSSIANDGVYINSLINGKKNYNSKLAGSIKFVGSIF